MPLAFVIINFSTNPAEEDCQPLVSLRERLRSARTSEWRATKGPTKSSNNSKNFKNQA
jgi:hypothetical protein